jgi:hypothetical protein
MPYLVEISDGEVGVAVGYVYAVVLPTHRVLYIGQTRNALGALGRLAQHVSYSSSATLRQRVSRHLGYDEVSLGPLRYLACPLGDEREFCGTSSVYREAVEAVTQARILNVLYDVGVSLVVLSHVERNGYVRQPLVTVAGDRVSAWIEDWLTRLHDEGDI